MWQRKDNRGGVRDYDKSEGVGEIGEDTACLHPTHLRLGWPFSHVDTPQSKLAYRVLMGYYERASWKGILRGWAERVYWEGEVRGCADSLLWEGVLWCTWFIDRESSVFTFRRCSFTHELDRGNRMLMTTKQCYVFFAVQIKSPRVTIETAREKSKTAFRDRQTSHPTLMYGPYSPYTSILGWPHDNPFVHRTRNEHLHMVDCDKISDQIRMTRYLKRRLWTINIPSKDHTIWCYRA